MTRSVAEVVEGVGLHTGTPSRVVLRVRAGPVRLLAQGVEATLSELEVASTARATTVEAHGGKLRVGTVEHAFAALAGLGVYEGVSLDVSGPELPLLDGSAARWCEAIAALGVPPGLPRLRVAREEELAVGPSRFAFRPGPTVVVEVRVELGDARLVERAAWAGDPGDFRARIAPARTFALAGEVEELARRGLARHVDPEAVVLIAPEAIHHAGRPFSADEPARHKLLDLVGDLYLWGGPPLGTVSAFRPGHAANARALRLARERGILV